ncbi:MAG: hypothetical protein ACOVOQ_00835 [Flavobacterium sp.]
MKLMQHYSDITTTNAIGGTFAKPHKPTLEPSFAKKPQANSPRQTRDDNKTDERKRREKA